MSVYAVVIETEGTRPAQPGLRVADLLCVSQVASLYRWLCIATACSTPRGQRCPGEGWAAAARWACSACCTGNAWHHQQLAAQRPLKSGTPGGSSGLLMTCLRCATICCDTLVWSLAASSPALGSDSAVGVSIHVALLMLFPSTLFYWSTSMWSSPSIQVTKRTGTCLERAALEKGMTTLEELVPGLQVDLEAMKAADWVSAAMLVA